MRNSNLLKWAQNKQNSDKSNKNWIHPAEVLQKGHIAYVVKFLGNTEVDQPKGIEVVKEGIRKLKFNQQLKKAEGTKIPKVELTISIDGVAIQEPKGKRIMHQYPLHRISYCADDKGEKKFFSFIAKESGDAEKHMCFVFVSDKLAEEITLTIGQAFDLAYKRFLETSGKDLEMQKRMIMTQQRIKQLEHENKALKQRLSDVLNGQASDLEAYKRTHKISDMLSVSALSDTSSADSDFFSSPSSSNGPSTNGSNGLLVNLNVHDDDGFNTLTTSSPFPPIPPRSFEKPNLNNNVECPAVGTKLEGLLLDELDDDFNPRAFESQSLSPPPLLAPPPKASKRASPPRSDPPVISSDPFGMGDFAATPAPTQVELENAIGFLDKRILEMKDGFSRGISFGNDDFLIESLDPLKK